MMTRDRKLALIAAELDEITGPRIHARAQDVVAKFLSEDLVGVDPDGDDVLEALFALDHSLRGTLFRPSHLLQAEGGLRLVERRINERVCEMIARALLKIAAALDVMELEDDLREAAVGLAMAACQPMGAMRRRFGHD